jgi:4-alpha-glucanotransferase
MGAVTSRGGRVSAEANIPVSSFIPRRTAGVFLHLTSLPGDHGIGELGNAAFQFVDFLAAAGLGVWQFLPTGPTGYGNSPYQSSSVYAGNPLLIELRALHDRGLVTARELAVFTSLTRGSVDYPKLTPLKTQLLARAGGRFMTRAATKERQARDEFVAEHDTVWLHDFALFEVLKAMHQERAWSEWDRAYVLRDPDALRTLEEAAHLQIDTAKSLQFLFFEQWRELKTYAASRGVRLMGDVPIYVALDSADAWAHPELLNLDASGQPTEVAGVPPDYFSNDGQLWGNPLYRWDRHAADGYQWWISRLGHAVDMADYIRLDHFRGFEAYWAVPAGAESATSGEWRAGPGEALFDALQSALGRLPIVAEDLGVITAEVEDLRDRYGLPGMKVLQFLVSGEKFDPASIPPNCVCYTGTHDNDTTLGWYRGGGGDARTEKDVEHTQANVLKHTHGTPVTIHEDLIKLAFSTSASLAIAPMQDYLGLDSSARMNMPGSSAEGNWRWRLRTEQLTQDLCETIRQMVIESGRALCVDAKIEYAASDDY